MDSFEDTVKEFCENLKTISANFCTFSGHLQELFAEKEISFKSDDMADFRKLLLETKENAIVYCDVVLPCCSELIRFVNDFFKVYECLPYPQWKRNLSNLLSDVKGYKQSGYAIVHMHESIMTALLNTEERYNQLTEKLIKLSKKYDEEKDHFRAEAREKRDKARWVAFVPFLGKHAKSYLLQEADCNTVDAIAKGAQSELNISASNIISKDMIPAFKNCINDLNRVSHFFNEVEKELQNLSDKQPQVLECHYNTIQSKSTDVRRNCVLFRRAMIVVISDLKSLSNDLKNKNFVDKWAEAKKTEITKLYRNSGITGQLSKVMLILLGQVESDL